MLPSLFPANVAPDYSVIIVLRFVLQGAVRIRRSKCQLGYLPRSSLDFASRDHDNFYPSGKSPSEREHSYESPQNLWLLAAICPAAWHLRLRPWRLCQEGSRTENQHG